MFKKIKSTLIVSFFYMMYGFNANACEDDSITTAEVYCTNQSGSTWGILRYQDQSIFTVSGVKGRLQNMTGNFIEYLTISKEDYDNLKLNCEYAADLGGLPEVNIPRPLWGFGHYWYMFADENGLVMDRSTVTQFDGDNYCT